MYILFDITACPRLIFQYRELLLQMVKRTIASRYRGSALGLFWSIAQPLMMLSVYTFVFTYVLKAKFGIPLEDSKPGAFSIIMFCGMAVYNIFSESVAGCCSLIAGNQNLVKKVIFPLELLPIIQVMASLFFGLFWFILLFLGAVFLLQSVSWTMFFLPLTLIPLLLFTCGICFIVASLGAFLRDLQHFIGVILQVLFFMTPIFYSVKAIPEKYRIFLYMNPLCELVEQTRAIFLYGDYPNWSYLTILWLGAIVIFHLGFVWFVKTKKGFADVL